MFLVAHQLDTVKEMCDRVIWIDEGRMHMDGDPEEVVAASPRPPAVARPEKQRAGEGRPGEWGARNRSPAGNAGMPLCRRGR